jgi:Flp pilus assembly protein TadG
MTMAIAMQPPRPMRGGEEGSTAIETALILSILLAMIFGVIEFGTTLFQWNTMLLAVEQAGRYVMINNTTAQPSDAKTQMKAVLTNATDCVVTNGVVIAPSAGNVCVYAKTTAGTPPSTPNTMTLEAIYAYDVIGLTGSLVGLAQSGPFTVMSQATFPLD